MPQPRLRFLLADDSGIGKTIMAGLLIKEMRLSEVIDRVLILCPAPLTIQRQDELLRWFGEFFDIILPAVDQQQAAFHAGDPLRPKGLIHMHTDSVLVSKPDRLS